MKLLCQLWSLNESLQEYKKSLEDADDDEVSQREVASILESHLEEDLIEEEDDVEEELEEWKQHDQQSLPEKGIPIFLITHIFSSKKWYLKKMYIFSMNSQYNLFVNNIFKIKELN